LSALGALTVAIGAGDAAGRGDPYDEPDPELVLGTVLQRAFDRHEGELMHDAGIESVRFWLSWGEVEAKRDEFDWSGSDEVVRELAAAGVTPMPFLFGSPAWAAQLDDRPCDGFDCLPWAPASAVTRAAFGRFAGLAVRRYGPDGVFWQNNPGLQYRPIRVWQLWNEANLTSFHMPAPNPLGFAELVRVASPQIRGEDPDAEIVLGGLFGNRTNSRRLSTQEFLRRFYTTTGVGDEIGDYFDGIALHPYAASRRGTLAQVATGHKVAVKRDPDVDVWITEIGWASRGNAEKWNLVKSTRGQARMLRRVFTRLLEKAAAWDLRSLHWYAWRDTERGQSVCGWCGAAGLLNRDFTPKPAYRALRQLAPD
jgi:hypothetical protein